MKKLVVAMLVPFLFVSCESTKGTWESVKDTVQANATGHVGFTPNEEGGYEAKATASTGLFGYDIYGEAKTGFRKSIVEEPLPQPVVTPTVK